MSDWREVEFGGHRIRWRDRGDHYSLHYWHETRREWREVRSLSSRDFFAMGVVAGLEMARQGVQEDLFP